MRGRRYQWRANARRLRHVFAKRQRYGDLWCDGAGVSKFGGLLSAARPFEPPAPPAMEARASRITLESYELSQWSPRRPPSFRAQQPLRLRARTLARQRGGRKRAAPKGRALDGGGNPNRPVGSNPSLSVTLDAPSLHVGVRRWHPSICVVPVSGHCALRHDSAPAGGRALR